MSIEIRSNRCGTCLWWERLYTPILSEAEKKNREGMLERGSSLNILRSYNDYFEWGYCKRHASEGENSGTAWPMTIELDWCGDWEAKE